MKLIADLKNKVINNYQLLIILLFSLTIFMIGISWGLPNYDTWQSDSLAPTIPVQAMFNLYSFGYGMKYPIVHQFILSIFNIPVVFAAFINSFDAGGFNKELFKDLIFRDINYLSALSLTDAIVSAIMGMLTVLFIYLITKELFNKKAGLFAALIASLNITLNHYSHVAKVETPYIFWALVSVYYIIKAVKYNKTADYVLCSLFICLSFGTKDQAYSFFILPLLFYLLIYKFIINENKENYLKIIFSKNNIYFIISFIIFTVIVENMILNYTGLIKRIGILTGEHGFRSAVYAPNFICLLLLAFDSFVQIKEVMTLPFFILSISGMLFLFIEYRSDRKKFLLSLIGLIVTFSYFIFFLAIVKQSTERFQMPSTIIFSIYAGYSIFYLLDLIKKWENKYLLITGRLLIILFYIYAFYNTFSFNVNILFDVRYEAEKWMKTNIAGESKIEYYTGYTNLPRFSDDYKHYRVKTDLSDIEKRNPDYIVLTSKDYTKYYNDEADEKNSENKINFFNCRIVSDKTKKRIENNEYVKFFDSLINRKYNYETVKRFDHKILLFKKHPLVPDHIIILARKKQ